MIFLLTDWEQNVKNNCGNSPSGETPLRTNCKITKPATIIQIHSLKLCQAHLLAARIAEMQYIPSNP